MKMKITYNRIKIDGDVLIKSSLIEGGAKVLYNDLLKTKKQWSVEDIEDRFDMSDLKKNKIRLGDLLNDLEKKKKISLIKQEGKIQTIIVNTK